MCLVDRPGMQGQYRESLAAVAMYESPESREKPRPASVQSLKVQIGLAYNYNGDLSKSNLYSERRGCASLRSTLDQNLVQLLGTRACVSQH